MGLYPPSIWSYRIEGVVASFRLESKNRGLDPTSSCSWRICKLVLPMNEFLIYIRNNYVAFSHLGFHLNIGVLCI
jgi:hypothetical protein